jgi:hypothetical protein
MSSRRFARWLAAAVLISICLPAISHAVEAVGPPAPGQATKALPKTLVPQRSPVPAAASTPTPGITATSRPEEPPVPAAASTPTPGVTAAPRTEEPPAGVAPVGPPDLAEKGDDIVLTPEPYYYESLGRRDIFVSLISEEYEKENPNPRPVSGELHVVGILWAEKDRFALLETEDGRSLILREGGSLGDGEVVQILPDRVVIHVTEYGSSRTKSLPLEQGGGWNENPRSRNR